MKLRYNAESILNRIVTCDENEYDEKWILYNNRRRSAQWLDASEASKQIPKPNFYLKKIMVSVWWTSEGIVHYSFTKQNKQTEAINLGKYCQEVATMHQKLYIKRPAWSTDMTCYCYTIMLDHIL